MSARPTPHLEADRGLEARMSITLFLLGLLYVAFVAALLLAGVQALVVVLVAAVVLVAQLLLAERGTLHALGATTVSPAAEPQLHAALDRLCVQADVPKPRLALSPIAAPNALMVGRRREKATLCVTEGLRTRLTPGELEAVLAHELAHLVNRDVAVMTLASFFGLVAGFVVKFGWRIPHAVGKLAVLLAATVTYVLSWLLLRALSRQRELVADRTAALLTGRPSALASALLKTDAGMARLPEKDLRTLAPVSALAFAGLPAKHRLARLVADHPSTECRVRALERMEEQLQGRAVQRG